MTDIQIETPQWVRDAVFYQIFPDRFAISDKLAKPRNLETWHSPPTSHGFKGGDLLGVVERLDYLVDLGINAIYFNPVFQSASNHRYHTYDYYNIDPLLGGNKAFKTLLDAAHSRGIRVVLDGVFNHASRGFFQFHDILENGPFSPYIDWFNIHKWPLNAYETSQPPNYDAWWHLPALPKFNIKSEAVREYLLGVGEYWVEFGIDGWRLDVPAEIDDDAFWQEFRRRVKRANPDAYIVGEIWHDARHWLKGDQFDAVMNYLFTKLCIEFFIVDDIDPELVKGSSLAPVRDIWAMEFAQEIEALWRLYPPEVRDVQLNLLDSHDTARYISMAGGDKDALKLATLFQMVSPGAPCIYYGDEIGLSGGRDPYCRASFPWDEAEWDHDLLGFIKKTIKLRHTYPSLRRGSYHTLCAEGAAYAIARQLGEETVFVVFNVGREAWGANIPTFGLVPDDAVLTDVLGGQEYSVGTGYITAHVPARTAMVLTEARG